VPGETGGRETYARELALALAEHHPDLSITSFVNRDAARQDGFWTRLGRVIRIPVSPSSRLSWAWAETVGVPVAAARAGVEVLHSPANFGPVAGPFASVLTLHDVLFRSHPEMLGAAMRLGTEALLPVAARRADRVLTVSDFARNEIIERLGLRPERVTTVPNGVAAPARAGDAAAGRRLAGGQGRSLVLSVASDLPHKNLPLLIDAVATIAAGERPLLALAGSGTDGGRLLAHARGAGVEGDVRCLGAVGPDALEDLYAAADALVSVTLHEGFGLTVLEAMARGVPVACSRIAVLREVAGDDVEWLDPRDPASVAAALGRVLASGAEVDRRVAAGRARAASFTWRHAAERTLEAYREAADARSRPSSEKAR
jgi:glycosyltransferase involved in cell wall biosynthesis